MPMSWDPKVTAITKVKDLDKLEFDNLLGSLITHEIMMKRNDVESKKDKNVAFKAKNEEKGSQDMEDDEFALLARKFMKNDRFS